MHLLVLLRVLLSVSASAMQKGSLRGGAPASMFWLLTYAWMGLAAAVLIGGSGHRPSLGVWGWLAFGGFMDAVGNLVMMAALRRTDLSIFGPLSAIRPILAFFAGWLLLGERPSLAGLAGIGVIVASGWLLLAGGAGAWREAGRGGAAKMVALRVGGLACSSVGAVFLKRGAGETSVELALAVWVLAGLATLGLWRALASGIPRERGWDKGAPGALPHALVFLAMQWMTIHIFKSTLLAYSFAYFQLGMVLQVAVGAVWFKEPEIKRRLGACLGMAAGAGLVAWAG